MSTTDTVRLDLFLVRRIMVSNNLTALTLFIFKGIRFGCFFRRVHRLTALDLDYFTGALVVRAARAYQGIHFGCLFRRWRLLTALSLDCFTGPHVICPGLIAWLSLFLPSRIALFCNIQQASWFCSFVRVPRCVCSRDLGLITIRLCSS